MPISKVYNDPNSLHKWNLVNEIESLCNKHELQDINVKMRCVQLLIYVSTWNLWRTFHTCKNI